jgi:hypothetical protein
MVESAEHRPRDHWPVQGCRRRHWRFELQTPVRSVLGVVADIFSENPKEMALVHDDDVVEALLP